MILAGIGGGRSGGGGLGLPGSSCGRDGWGGVGQADWGAGRVGGVGMGGSGVGGGELGGPPGPRGQETDGPPVVFTAVIFLPGMMLWSRSGLVGGSTCWWLEDWKEDLCDSQCQHVYVLPTWKQKPIRNLQ